MDDGKKEYMMYGGRRNGWDKDRQNGRKDGRKDYGWTDGKKEWKHEQMQGGEDGCMQ